MSLARRDEFLRRWDLRPLNNRSALEILDIRRGLERVTGFVGCCRRIRSVKGRGRRGMRHCRCGHGPWHHWGYGYGPPPYAPDYGPEYRYGPPRRRRRAPGEEGLAGYLASRGGEGG